MAGNVAEWVADWYAEDYAPGSARDPKGPASGTYRVARGGDWTMKDPSGLRAANRKFTAPESVFANFGVRCAMDAPR
jgi:formylglycine-generating enzyme required for sulfatase activity